MCSYFTLVFIRCRRRKDKGLGFCPFVCPFVCRFVNHCAGNIYKTIEDLNIKFRRSALNKKHSHRLHTSEVIARYKFQKPLFENVYYLDCNSVDVITPLSLNASICLDFNVCYISGSDEDATEELII